jgi:hypothetical protein
MHECILSMKMKDAIREMSFRYCLESDVTSRYKQFMQMRMISATRVIQITP